MLRPYGYDTYRGRSKWKTALTIIIIVLLVVLAAAVAAFFLLQKYVVYTDDGRARLELPFFQQQEAAIPEPSGDGELPVVVVTAEPSPEPTQAPAFLAVSLPRAALTDGTAAAQAAAVGANAVYFDMKADDGTLGYVSALPAAISMGTSAANANLNEAIADLSASGLYTVARVSCFRDNLAPRMDNSLAVRTNSGYNWRDAGDIRWMNPAVEEARDYVAGVCRELAALGFDEIVLDNACYPVDGHLDYIKRGATYDTANLSQPLELFYAQVKEALSDYPQVVLSIVADRAALTGESGNQSGQTPELLERSARRIWTPAVEWEGADAVSITAAGLQPDRIVLTGVSAIPTGLAGALLPSES